MYASHSNLGGLLREQYLQNMFEPKLNDLRPAERRHMKSIRSWANRSHAKSWKMFHDSCLLTLENIAEKYEVSMENIAIRWAMELDALGTTIVTSDLLDEDINTLPKNLRSVLRFALDEDDRDRIKRIAQKGTTGVRKPSLSIDEEQLYMLKNQRLWL